VLLYLVRRRLSHQMSKTTQAAISSILLRGAQNDSLQTTLLSQSILPY
jgi:hypothetical protein